MDFKTFIASERFTKGLIIVGLILAALVVFQAGIAVGEHRAGFSYRGGENYYRVFGNPQDPMSGMFNEELSEGDGTVGKIISVHLPSFVVEDNDQTEKTVLVSTSTTIRNLRDATSSTALSPGEYVIVIGDPTENSEIDARFIRLLPPPPAQ